jgi:hypothetical protein
MLSHSRIHLGYYLITRYFVQNTTDEDMYQRDSLIPITCYSVQHHLLKQLIKCFWVVTSDRRMHYELVLVNSIDDKKVDIN